MSFSIDMLRSRLKSSTEAVDSVTSTAHWILFHKRHASEIAQEWATVMATGDNKLCLIYIANEVIQQSKIKRKSEFVDAFAPVLPDALQSAYSSSNLATRDRIVRVVKVWRERLVFSESAQEAIEQALAKKTSEGQEIPENLVPLVKLYTSFLQKPEPKLVAQIKQELRALEAKIEHLDKSSSPWDAGKESPTSNHDREADSDRETASDQEAAPDNEGKLYTAANAARSNTHEESGEEDVGYAESGEDEPEPKKPKIAVDPKLASFLASLS